MNKKFKTLGSRNSFFGAKFLGHGYFSAEKFLVLAPAALAAAPETCASTEFRSSKFKTVLYFLTFVFVFLFLNLNPAYAALVQCGTSTLTAPCAICDIFSLISRVITFTLLEIVTPLATIAIIVGGIIFLTAGASPEKRTKGRKILAAAAIGIFLAFGAWVIVETILGTIIKESAYFPWNKFPTCQ